MTDIWFYCCFIFFYLLLFFSRYSLGSQQLCKSWSATLDSLCLVLCLRWPKHSLVFPSCPQDGARGGSSGAKRRLQWTMWHLVCGHHCYRAGRATAANVWRPPTAVNTHREIRSMWTPLHTQTHTIWMTLFCLSAVMHCLTTYAEVHYVTYGATCSLKSVWFIMLFKVITFRAESEGAQSSRSWYF